MRKPILILDAPSMAGKTYFIEKHLETMSNAGYRTVCLSDEQFCDMIVEACVGKSAQNGETRLAALKRNYDIIAIDNFDIALGGKYFIEETAAKFMIDFVKDGRKRVIISGIDLCHKTSRLYRAVKSRAKQLKLSRLEKPKGEKRRPKLKF